MANFNDTFSVPNDGNWHPIAALSTNDWFEMSFEVGTGRVALASKNTPPQHGQPATIGDRWAAPSNGAGVVYVKAEGDLPEAVLSGTMSGSGWVM